MVTNAAGPIFGVEQFILMLRRRGRPTPKPLPQA